MLQLEKSWLSAGELLTPSEPPLQGIFSPRKRPQMPLEWMNLKQAPARETEFPFLARERGWNTRGWIVKCMNFITADLKAGPLPPQNVVSVWRWGISGGLKLSETSSITDSGMIK